MRMTDSIRTFTPESYSTPNKAVGTSPQRRACTLAAQCRTDRILSNLGYCSRSECNAFIAKKDVTTNGERIRSCSAKVDPASVLIDGHSLDHPKGLLVALNKPKGYTCSHSRSEGNLVYDLVPQQWLARKPGITSVGRLDKDTTGLLLLTTVTGLVHKLTSPKQHVAKRYVAVLASSVEAQNQQHMINLFQSGELTLHGESSPCAPAQLQFRSSNECHVTVVEGRYHQVRRMFAACGAHVQELNRIAFGHIELDMLNIQQGDWMHLPLDLFESTRSQVLCDRTRQSAADVIS